MERFVAGADAVTARGLFIAFEGVEGAGKSTQAARLADALAAAGVPVRQVREPGTTVVGEAVRRLLLEGRAVPSRVELLLLLAARAALVEQEIRPALAAGTVVVADRFELSTVVYQGHVRGLPLDWIETLNRWATEALRPDAVVWLVLDPEEGLRRHRAAGKPADRLEAEGLAFHRRVAEAYAACAAADPRVLAVDAGGPVEEVHRRVVAALAARFPEPFARLRVLHPGPA